MREDHLSPYKGLMPYSEEDAQFFFGRDRERDIIIANLMASRLTLFYGSSGVGKSSVLRAGVAYQLRKLTMENLIKRRTPEFVIVVFSSWRDDPVAGLEMRIQDTMARIVAESSDNESREIAAKMLVDAPQTSGSFSQFLKSWADRIGGDLVIILDQFEEYFLYHSQEDGEGTFATEFPRAVNNPDLRVSFLISTREDSLAKLDRFKGRIPNLFDNYLRIEHLNSEMARIAIEKPIEQYNRLYGSNIGIEPSLLEAVLNQVSTGKVMLGGGGYGIVKGDLSGEGIETPYLQLVMTRLWDEEIRRGSNALSIGTLDRLGGAERIVKTHLDSVMNALPADERDTAAKAFHYLVTPSGTKIAHKISDLSEYTNLPQSELASVMNKLSGSDFRILRTVTSPSDQPGEVRYEIFHDVLALAILDWQKRYTDQRREDQIRQEEQNQWTKMREEEEKKHQLEKARNLRRAVSILSFLMIAMLGLAIFAFQQRYSAVKAKAEEQQQRVIAEAASKEEQQQRMRAEAASMEVARKNQSLQSLLFNVEKTLEQNKTIINLLSKMPDSKDRTSAMNELKELARTGKIPPESMPAVERLLKSYAEPVVIVARPRAYIQIQDKIQMEMANALRRRLEEMGYISGVELVKKGPDTTEVRFFYRIDESKAAEIVNILRDFGLSESRPAYVSGYEKSDLIKPGQYEIWLFNPAYERRMLQKAY